MSTMNALIPIVMRTKRGQWYSFYDLSVIVGEEMLNAGVPWKNTEDLIEIMITLTQIGFVEANTDTKMIRVHDRHYDDESI